MSSLPLHFLWRLRGEGLVTERWQRDELGGYGILGGEMPLQGVYVLRGKWRFGFFLFSLAVRCCLPLSFVCWRLIDVGTCFMGLIFVVLAGKWIAAIVPFLDFWCRRLVVFGRWERTLFYCKTRQQYFLFYYYLSHPFLSNWEVQKKLM